MQHPHQEHGGRHVDQHDGKLQDGDRRAKHRKQRRRQPGLHAEHVLIAVDEHREGAAFRDVLGHQSEDGLIGIEAGLLPEQEHRGTGQDERDGSGHGDGEPPLGNPHQGRPV